MVVKLYEKKSYIYTTSPSSSPLEASANENSRDKMQTVNKSCSPFSLADQSSMLARPFRGTTGVFVLSLQKATT